ncbi:hypothetical protein NPX13_g5091 [Xylaria arbuscula]|uniref:CHAT domain-containing protein n=1 Tax=Xylaria arbuscula TaxID=114810 RepID=A0A9W8NF16_9PEZI|nr:hypothetical protein NPX13_g5091 [Xylaria arbuscula]
MHSNRHLPKLEAEVWEEQVLLHSEFSPGLLAFEDDDLFVEIVEPEEARELFPQQPTNWGLESDHWDRPLVMSAEDAISGTDGRGEEFLEMCDHLGMIAVSQRMDRLPIFRQPTQPESPQAIIGEKFLATPTMENLEADIEAGWVTVEAATRADYPHKAHLLGCLGLLLSERYSRTGDIDDVEKAVQVAREACDSTPKFDYSLPMRLDNLAEALSQRYFATRRMADLDDAIRIWRVAAHILPDDDPHKPRFIVSLASVLGLKYSETKELECITEAIELGRHMVYNAEVIEIKRKTAYAMPESVRTLYTLSTNLYLRYTDTRVIADLEEAIQLIQSAILRADPDDHRWYLNRLCMLLYERYARTGNEADVEEAIRAGRKGLELGQHDYVEKARHFRVLADALYENYKIKSAAPDFNEAIEYFKAALHLPNSHVFDRVLAGRRLLQCFAVILDWSKAYETATAVMELIPTLSSRLVAQDARQDLLAELAGLSSDMGAVALNAMQEPFVALKFIEHSRNLVTAYLDETRSDISGLQDEYPNLAAELIQYRQLLDRHMAGPNIFNDPSFSHLFWRRPDTVRYEASQKLDQLVERIRSLPGFDDFLGVPDEAKIRTAATRGPVVVINVSKYRCDAILIETEQIRSLPLSKLTSREVHKRAQVSNLGSLSVMRWLWDSLAKPILDTLGYTGPPDNDLWPHVWWITSGVMSRFPIHAAGQLFTGSLDTVLDRVMSSYGTSIKSIIATRCHHVHPSEDQDEALLIAMEDTVGCSKLPYAREEVKVVGAVCREMGLRSRTSGNNTNLIDITKHLMRSRIMHFAGHGYTDAAEPRRSHLVIAGNDTFSTSENPGRLSVTKLLGMNLHNLPLFLAYLSACGTSRVRNNALADQTTIHLVGGCQIAGFRHVVGTLWEVVDRRCVDVARITYEAIREGGMTDESVCWGLHKAIRELRGEWIRSETKARQPTSTVGRSDTSVSNCEAGNSSSTGIGVECLEEPPRDIVPCDSDSEDETALPYWVPYVHYGV